MNSDLLGMRLISSARDDSTLKVMVLLTACALLVLAARSAAANPPGTAQLTTRELDQVTAGLSTAARARIHADPGGFSTLLSQAAEGPQDLLLLIDRTHGLPRAWTPSDLVSLDGRGFLVARKGLRLRKAAAAHLQAMAEDARRSGVTLVVASAYRSATYQENLFFRSVKKEGEKVTNRSLAWPGHSEHQLGTAVDFGPIGVGFASTPAGKWLASRAWEFGFILSYPLGSEAETGYMFEPWHYRYVGRSAAELIYSFFGGSRQEFLAFYAEHRLYLQQRLAKRSLAVSPPP
jgi:D-alanyl-D-alanine carboxypeptidase